VAYFSAEYGLHRSLPFYAGGLGFTVRGTGSAREFELSTDLSQLPRDVKPAAKN
jgi:hypothetical protein